MNRLITASVFIAISLMMAISCTPTTTYQPVFPTPIATQMPVSGQPVATIPVGQEAASWAKVVEAAKKEGRVTLYANTFTGDRSTALVQAFKQKYGISAEILLGRGAEFIERLKTERRSGSITGDIFEGSATHLGNAKLAGIMASAGSIPALQESKDNWVTQPDVLDSEGYILAYTHYNFGPSINSNLVKPGQEPKSWKELLDPKWKGKLIVYDPSISTGTYISLVPLINAKVLSADYVKELAKQEPTLAISGPQASQMMARGEYLINTCDNTLSAAPFVAEGAPIRAIDMKEGIVRNLTVVGLINDSPHPNAAKLFVNWLLSQEGQMVFGKASNMNVVRKGLPDFELEPLRFKPQNPVLLTASDNNMITDMFRDKAWVSLFRK